MWQFYYKVRQVLQSATIITKCDSTLGGKQFKQRCHVSVSAMSRNALRKAFFQQISDLSVPKAAYILTKGTIILLNI